MSTGKQRAGELWVLMQVRRLGIGWKNPLRRWSDHAETVLLWCALVLALLMIPAAAAIGTGVSHSLEASAARQRAVLHEVQGRTVVGTEGTLPSAPGSPLSLTQVSYVDPQGTEHEVLASVVTGTPAGATVPVWLDSSGHPVTAPRSESDNRAFGGTAGFFVVFGSWLLLWGLFRLACVPLNRRRLQDWDTEWREIAPRWLR
ncbi:Rv1733c family protein [Kribbella solani]|uniref:Uncharacterized protein n=1 Tax=Kribbella solani TaxID=236067 RepID=A0A841DN38_9ACTN|nr:hypothetical protein [Kribbella solani]MBB5978415.1 hypothetical protein [Kribbella solani]